jgi:hypothetical protein
MNLQYLIKKLIWVTVALAAISALVFYMLPAEHNTPSWPFLLLFFLATGILLSKLYIRTLEKKLSAFTNFFMLSTVAKLMIYLIIIIVYLIYNREDAAPFLLTFFVYYLVYTFLEVRSALKLQQQKQ